jgi:prepilin-type N-terminal cleavage/methylation domain-containing protein
MSRARGFTLLEVLLATVLMAVLMTGIWALVSTYEGLFFAGEARTEESQLVRTLLEQLSEDLRSAIPDSASGIPGASTSVRRFGLFGTERALQVDVLQVTPSQCVAVAAVRGEPAPSPGKPLQVPELHTVQYWFDEPLSDTAEGATAARGLVRRELDWETPPGGTDEEAMGARGPSSAGLSESADEGDLSTTPDPMSVVPLAAASENPSILRAPEVIDLRFRYYDGSAWGTQWNSLERKSLPVAIEVTLKVKSGDKPRPRAPARQPVDPLEELAAEMGTPVEETGRTHRLLVCLPSTGLLRPAKAQAEGLPSILEEPEVPLLPEYVPLLPPPRPAPPSLAPPLTPPAPREPGPPPSGRKSLEEMLRDQWIRTGRQ